MKLQENKDNDTILTHCVAVLLFLCIKNIKMQMLEHEKTISKIISPHGELEAQI